MVRRARLSLASATIALACGACVAVFGMDPLSEKPPVDGGTLDVEATDASEPDADADAGACGPHDIGAVGKPDASPRSQSDGGSVHYVFTLLDLGIDPNAERPGFDLDRQLTVDRATSSCLLPEGTEIALQYGRDTPSGVDNVGFGLSQALGGFVAAFNPERINARLVSVIYGVVLRIDGWNGADDDDDVVVFVFPTIGSWRPDGDGGLIAGGDRSAQYDPDAGDLLAPDARFRSLTIGSTIRSDEAWINGGKLVARFDRMTLPLRSSVDELRPFDLEMHEAWMTATIAPGRASLTEGAIGGRAPTGPFITQVQFIYDPFSGSHLCGAVESNLGLLCGARDIRSSHCDDGTAAPCNALSFGIRFAANRLDKIGPFRKRTDDDFREAGQAPPSERCDAGNVAPIDCPP